MQGNQQISLDGYDLTAYTYYKDLATVRFISLPFLQRGSAVPTRGFLRQVAAGKAQLYYYNSAITL